jgi:deoxyribonuclease V
VILAVDVGYNERAAQAAGVLFNRWDSEAPAREVKVEIGQVAEYVPGQFYLRELPCILELLARLDAEPDCIVIDGYVGLGEEQRPGLGHHLWISLGCRIPVIGVAKTYFHGTPAQSELYRGASARPLYVTSAGMPLDEAKGHIINMHGAYRVPTLLKAVDALSRDGCGPAKSG